MTVPTAPRNRQKRERDWPSLWTKARRDMVICCVGVFLLVNESLSGGERPYLIAAGLACFGIPFVIRADERKP